MIIDCISDLHGYYPKLEGGDLLIVAGDLTARDTKEDYANFMRWLDPVSSSYKKVVLVAGNHDNLVQEHGKEILPSCCDYLCDSVTEFEGLKIWGSPWTKTFPGMNPKCMAFTVDMYQSLKDKWDLIPDDINILVTHSPPFGFLDQAPLDYGAHVGDIDLRDALYDRIEPKLHVFGHIHEHGGKKIVLKRPSYGTENNTICVNASHVNEYYKPVNKPVRIIL